jgi:hypothetical protein
LISSIIRRETNGAVGALFVIAQKTKLVGLSLFTAAGSNFYIPLLRKRIIAHFTLATTNSSSVKQYLNSGLKKLSHLLGLKSTALTTPQRFTNNFSSLQEHNATLYVILR